MYKWDATAVDLVEREDVTAVAGVPTTMFELLDEARQGRARALDSLPVSSGPRSCRPSWCGASTSSSPSPPAASNGYGLTETSGAAIANIGAATSPNPESVGKPISPVIEVRIDPDGGAGAVGEVGEIWLQGPTIVGLPRPAEETAAAFTDGWFHTGDLGRVDDEGNLYVVDRIKDIIIRGGENMYAAEIEAALYEHPDVTEAAIIGVPDERLGEEVGAVVRGPRRRRWRRGPEQPRRRPAGRLKVPAFVDRRESCRATRAARCSSASCATAWPSGPG